MNAIDGKKILIKGPVTFRGGGYYFGRNMACRVLLAPALGSEVRSNARYVVQRQDLWFGTAFEGGYIACLNYDPAPIEKIPIDIEAFEWRRQRTSRLWVRQPFIHEDSYGADDPFVLHSRYSDEIDDLVLTKEAGFVYFIRAAAMNRVRIGWTTDPGRRPGELVRSSPVMLEYAALLPGTQEDESWLQYKFRSANVHDDWFDLTPELNEYIEWSKENWRKPGQNPIISIYGKAPVGNRGIDY